MIKCQLQKTSKNDRVLRVDKIIWNSLQASPWVQFNDFLETLFQRNIKDFQSFRGNRSVYISSLVEAWKVRNYVTCEDYARLISFYFSIIVQKQNSTAINIKFMDSDMTVTKIDWEFQSVWMWLALTENSFRMRSQVTNSRLQIFTDELYLITLLNIELSKLLLSLRFCVKPTKRSISYVFFLATVTA